MAQQEDARRCILQVWKQIDANGPIERSTVMNAIIFALVIIIGIFAGAGMTVIA